MGIIFIVALIGIVLLLIHEGGSFSTRGTDIARTHADAPGDILGARYARGEIDRAEYLERRRELV